MAKRPSKSEKPRRRVRKDEDANWRRGIDAKIAEVEKRLTALESAGTGWRDALSSAMNKPRERGPILADHELRERRDDLYDFCSYHWPELTLVISKAKSAEDLLQYLQFGFTGNVHLAEKGQRLVEYCAALSEFTHSKRYHGDPLQVANALAGLPELEWRTSWNRCSKIHSRLPAHMRSYRDYLRRHFRRFRELLAATTEDARHQILDQTSSQAVIILTLRGAPDVSEYLSAGEPRWQPIFG